MHIRLTDDAFVDLVNLREYLEPKSPQGFQRITTAIFTTMAQLETFPFLGREGRVEETFELAVPKTPFLLIYSINDPLYVGYRPRPAWEDGIPASGIMCILLFRELFVIPSSFQRLDRLATRVAVFKAVEDHKFTPAL